MVAPLLILISTSALAIPELHHARAFAFSPPRRISHSPMSSPPSSSSSSSFSPAVVPIKRRPGARTISTWKASAGSDDSYERDDEMRRRIRSDVIGSSDDYVVDESRGARRTFRDVDVAGVSVSPFGFLALLRSSSSSSSYRRHRAASSSVDPEDDEYRDVGDDDDAAVVAFPIFLTSPPPPPIVPSSPIDGDVAYSSSSSSSSSLPPPLYDRDDTMPSLFSWAFANQQQDESTANSPEALTFLQLLNGVDMANVLPPDALDRACAYYAFSLLEKEEEEEEGEEEEGRGGGRHATDDDDIIAEVEDELGLDEATTTIDDFEYYDVDYDGPRGDDGGEKSEFEDVLDYVRSAVSRTLPPDAGGYINASPNERARARLPRVWLRGVRLEEVIPYEALADDYVDEDGERGSMMSHAMETNNIGRFPIRFVLECSVDGCTKILEIPLFAIPSSSASTYLEKRHLRNEVEISSDILQELSRYYNIETSASFIALSLFYRYTKSGIVSAAARSTYEIPTLRVSIRLLQILEEMQRHQDRNIMTNDDDAIVVDTTSTTRYCWVIPASDSDRDREGKRDDGIIDSIILNNGLPLYRPLSRIQNEGTLGGSDGGSDGGGAGSGTDKKLSLTFEQQAKQIQLQSAWKIATQKDDAGALGRIREAMEELKKEVMMMGVGGGKDDEGAGENSTLMMIRRAMMSHSEDEEEVVGLMSDLEEAAMLKLDIDFGDEV
ncbi:hypothetical protein ACHAXA_005123 [Cyclostephanos tholiformis]|uniref:Uncharacterized protein n=1 Tax=Cyclostephanos tholiformis TaxID=382380 RepID=A0ABD3RX96_9STRA